jgi:hypothetical protein
MTDDEGVASIRAERLLGVIQIWLWEFEDPQNWPSSEAVREMVGSLERRTDAASDHAQRAIAECRDYLAQPWV